MTTTAVVSTECPTCGAPLDFDDAARAIRCAHCRSQLLITGRRQVLSYTIPARIAESDARSLVRFSLPADRQAAHVGGGTLYLVPYYRLTAEEIAWQRGDSERSRRQNVRDMSAFLGVPVPGSKEAMDVALEGDDASPRFTSRVLERNFVARETSVVPHSLGVRPAALGLRLFDRETTGEAVVVSADLTPRSARERAVGDGGGDVRSRELLRVVLQMVYFPFWMVPINVGSTEAVAVVDGVSGKILCDDAEPDLVTALGTGARRRTRTLGFRALVCPNCGWDLPLRPDDILFQCSSCERGWLARGDRLDPISFGVANGEGDVACHLPVWRVGGLEGAAIFAPAFRCRRVKALFDLGARLTRQASTIPRADDIPSGLVGCALDEEDARALARFIAVGIADEAVRGAARPALAESVEGLPIELLWLPFSTDGYALRELMTGAPIPQRLLDREPGSG
ncbi:MAG: hypothetical protein P8R42_14470 [Candidatus Binatia bacterium]|nr:hypothetical protein [Candidatus Binatia bacterium]